MSGPEPAPSPRPAAPPTFRAHPPSASFALQSPLPSLQCECLPAQAAHLVTVTEPSTLTLHFLRCLLSPCSSPLCAFHGSLQVPLAYFMRTEATRQAAARAFCRIKSPGREGEA